jgi:hypothetical protein
MAAALEVVESPAFLPQPEKSAMMAAAEIIQRGLLILIMH